MNAPGHLLLFALCCSVLTPVYAQDASAAPVPYAARYQASANGLSASAKRILTQLENGQYELRNELEATVLGQTIARLEQRSLFHFVDDTLVTDEYTYRLSGISSDRRSIEFDWEAGTAISREDDESWTLALQDQVFDPLSHQLALRQQLRTGRLDEYAFAVIDGDEIEQHRYQFIGEEVLQTPLGYLQSLKFERVREGSSSRSTVIWLAPDWHYLVARIEQVNGSGLQIKLELDKAEVGGEVVSALP